MRKLIRAFKSAQDFNPTLLGILVNPYFIVRYNVFKGIKKFSSSFKNGRLLDFGCGSKPYRSLFKVDEYVGLDTNNSGHSHKNENIDVLYDGKKIPFDDSTFDYIFSSEVLEHVFNIDEIISDDLFSENAISDTQVVDEDQHKIIIDEAFENPDLNQSALDNYVPPSPASSTHSVYHPPDTTNQSDSDDSDSIPGNVFF